MPRQIFTEEPVHFDGQEEQQSTVSKRNVTVIETSKESTLITSHEMEKLFHECDGQEEQQSTVSKGNVTVIETSEESTLITSHEMEKLFHEWSVTGKNNLMINPTLAERIRQYLRYQEELDPLKYKLAERIYKPFVVNCENAHSSSYDLYINKQKMKKLYFYYINDVRLSVIHISGFRYILTQVGNPYAPYIDVSEPLFIDIRAYALNNNGDFVFENEAFHFTLG